MLTRYVEKLQLSRSQRLAMLTTTYPQVHWIALTLLGLSVVFGFLLAADQQTLLFLAPVQVRVRVRVGPNPNPNPNPDPDPTPNPNP